MFTKKQMEEFRVVVRPFLEWLKENAVSGSKIVFEGDKIVFEWDEMPVISHRIVEEVRIASQKWICGICGKRNDTSLATCPCISKAWEGFEIDKCVLYRQKDSEAWSRGHFAGIINLSGKDGGGFPSVFMNGQTSFTTSGSFSVYECKAYLKENK